MPCSLYVVNVAIFAIPVLFKHNYNANTVTMDLIATFIVTIGEHIIY